MGKTTAGIDLGTTYSAVAYVDENGRPRTIPNAEGLTETPSVVLIQDGRIVVGTAALNQWVTNEERVVRWIKRSIGDNDYRFQGLSPVEISAEILKSLKYDAETHLGQPLDEVVITCPAYFAAVEIENTRHAGELAGLKVREIVKEPTAAAVYYGVDNLNGGEKLLVCDLGGGTFDATILTLQKGVFIPLASMGDRQLGGHDWTMQLVELVSDRFLDRFGSDPRNDPVAAQSLYEACEQAKRDFARLAEIAIPCNAGGRIQQIVVTRDEFESKTEWRIQQVVMWCERALEKARPPLGWRQIDRILLVGGSSRLRRMGLALAEASGRSVTQTGDPNLMVALGAAILADGRVRPRKPGTSLVEARKSALVEVEYRRMTVRALGTRVVAFDGGSPRVVNSLIIPAGMEAPVSRSRDDYAVTLAKQPHFDVPVIEFESEDDRDVVGNYRFRCLPNARRGDPIRVTFEYNVSGEVHVQACDLNSGQSLPGERLPYQEPEIGKAVRFSVRSRWVVFAVDTSGSMSGSKIERAKEAVVSNSRQLLNIGGPECRVGVVGFGAESRVLCGMTADLAAIERAIRGLSASGGTAMDAGILAGLGLLNSAPDSVDSDIVMVTDGIPNDPLGAMVAANSCRAKGVAVSSVSIGIEEVDQEFLDRITENLSLQIEDEATLAEAMTTLLTQSAARRGSLVDAGHDRETKEGV